MSKGTNKTDRFDPLHPNEIAADIQDVQKSRHRRRDSNPRPVVKMKSFNAVKETDRFNIPGNSFQGKTFRRMCGAWAREVIVASSLNGEEHLGDWVACCGTDYVAVL